MSFLAPKPQVVAPPPAPPTPAQDKTKKAMDDAETAQSTAKGKAATMLTGGAGLDGPQISSRRTLLGN